MAEPRRAAAAPAPRFEGGRFLIVEARFYDSISADLLAYQAVRAGLTGHQWWLAPLGWSAISGHPARQVLIGVLVPMLFVLLLAGLARRSWRYERVPPPFKGTQEPPRRQCREVRRGAV